MGIAGVNTRPLMRAADPLLGIAGNWGSTLRPHVARVVEPGASISKARLGDQAALHAWRRACYFFQICCDEPGVRSNQLATHVGKGLMIHAQQRGDVAWIRLPWSGAGFPAAVLPIGTAA